MPSGRGKGTGVLGIIGYPIEHSLSPVMHNAAFDYLGMEYRYLAFSVPPEALAEAVAGIRGLGLVGVNVTVPHKEKIIPLLDDLSLEARLIGAVNTVQRRENRLIGHNTDGRGFVASLRKRVKRPLRGSSVLILGAGGAARGVATQLLLEGVGRLTVTNRTPERAGELAGCLRKVKEDSVCVEIRTVRWASEGLAQALGETDFLINATSVGMLPRGDETPLLRTYLEALPKTAVVADLVYNPLRTRLLRESAEMGLEVVSGLGMLVEQAVLAWEVWFGREAPGKVMQEAAAAHLDCGEAGSITP